METKILMTVTALVLATTANGEKINWRERLKEGMAESERHSERINRDRQHRESIRQRERIHREESIQREQIRRELEQIRRNQDHNFRWKPRTPN
jgi:hypothetical protein